MYLRHIQKLISREIEDSLTIQTTIITLATITATIKIMVMLITLFVFSVAKRVTYVHIVKRNKKMNLSENKCKVTDMWILYSGVTHVQIERTVFYVN